MTFQTKIIGADFQTNCDCCGRALKVGVQLSGLGVYGADCIRAAISFRFCTISPPPEPPAKWPTP